MLEQLVRDIHSSLLRKFLNYGRKKVYNIGPAGQQLFSYNKLQRRKYEEHVLCGLNQIYY
jgi:hypothetical protein